MSNTKNPGAMQPLRHGMPVYRKVGHAKNAPPCFPVTDLLLQQRLDSKARRETRWLYANAPMNEIKLHWDPSIRSNGTHKTNDAGGAMGLLSLPGHTAVYPLAGHPTISHRREIHRYEKMRPAFPKVCVFPRLPLERLKETDRR